MTSKVWEHFNKNIEDKTAQCIHCNAVLQCKSGNTSGLIYHLSKHKIEIVLRKNKRRSSADILDNKIEEAVLPDQEFRTGSGVWRYFIKIPDENKAQCNICYALLRCKYGATSGLLYHLQTHNIRIVPKKTGKRRPSTDVLVHNIEEVVLSEQDLTTGSGVWRYFTKTPGEDNAQCNFCQASLRCKYGTTSGLLYHLQTHNIHIVPKKTGKRRPSTDILEHNPEIFESTDKDSNCRFCMKSIKTVDTTEIDEQYRELFEDMTSIKFESLENYSKFACGKCCYDLRRFETLKQRFIENQEKIVKLLKNVKVPDTVEEIVIKNEKFEPEEEKVDPNNEGNLLFSELFIKQETVADPELVSAQDILVQSFAFDKIPEENFEETSKDSFEESTVQSATKVRPLILDARSNYECDLCGKEFLMREKIRTHLRSHTQIFPKVRKYHYTCPCGAKFKYKKEQVQHVMEFHPHEKCVVCHVCARNFYDKRQFEVHMRRHSGIKPYECDFEGCGKSFFAKEILKNHKKTHVEPTVCEICSKIVKNLKSHMQQHTGYKHKCEFKLENGNTCGRSFLTNSNLQHHMAIHAGEMRYSCKQCGVKYSRVNTLNYHIRTIHMNFRVTCTVDGCELQFVRKENLRHHIKALHKNLSPEDFKEALEKIKLLKMPALDGLK